MILAEELKVTNRCWDKRARNQTHGAKYYFIESHLIYFMLLLLCFCYYEVYLFEIFKTLPIGPGFLNQHSFCSNQISFPILGFIIGADNQFYSILFSLSVFFQEEDEEEEEEEELEEDATDRLRNDLNEIYDNDTNRLAAVQVGHKQTQPQG